MKTFFSVSRGGTPSLDMNILIVAIVESSYGGKFLVILEQIE